MKTDARTSIALVLLTIGATAVMGTAPAQDAQPQQPAVPPQPTQPQVPQPAPAPSVPTQQAPQPAAPPPAQYVPPSPPPAQYVPPSPPPAQYSPPPPAVPQSPPPARYPSSAPYPYLPQQQPAAPPQQLPPPPPPQWEHSESTYPGGDSVNTFRYHPFRFHIDGGGTLTEKENAQDYADGWNAGFGLTWYPTSHLPLGLRLDGTYNEFNIRNPLLAQVAQANGAGVYHGFQRMWGGDVDLELDLHLSPYVHTYLLAGGGWYKQETLFRQSYFDNGYGCDWWSCGLTVARYDRDWTFARNAGLGLEFPLGPDASFFVEGRYMRLNPTDAKSDYIPIHAGLRF